MANRRKFLGANWKMNSPPAGSFDSGSPYHASGDTEIVVFPTFLDLAECLKATLVTGGQCGRPQEAGAFTGDVSMKHLKTLGVTHVLCGHSERRAHHGETDEYVGEQVSAALAAGLIPILCIGETADQREMDQIEEILAQQMRAVLESPKMIIAYEPVWAIGTGVTPTSAEAEKTHAFIRRSLKNKDIRIIYGGSVSADNAAGFFAETDIDGGLIGGASLKPKEFASIVAAARGI